MSTKNIELQKGFFLIEILVGMLVISIGIGSLGHWMAQINIQYKSCLELEIFIEETKHQFYNSIESLDGVPISDSLYKYEFFFNNSKSIRWYIPIQ